MFAKATSSFVILLLAILLLSTCTPENKVLDLTAMFSIECSMNLLRRYCKRMCDNFCFHWDSGSNC